MGDGSYPSGIRTNYDWLLQRVREQSSGPSVTLLEAGDLQRLYDEKYLYTEEAFQRIKSKVLRDLDRFLGQLTMLGDSLSLEEGRSGGSNRQLWLFSPQVNADAAKQKALLVPLMIYSAGGQEGLLSSATTRRSGIVSFVDVAPTLLQAFRLEVPETMLGLPIQLEPKTGAWSALLEQVQQIKQVYAIRPSLLYGLAVYEITVMLSALGIGLFAVKRLGRRAREIGKALLFSLLLAPAGLLCMGGAPQGSPWLVAMVCLGGVFLLSALCARYASSRTRTIVCLAFIGIGVGILLLTDGYQGAEAMQHSVLGYDVMIGARYYGMGNECMGVLLGAVLLGLTALQQSLRQSRQSRRGQPASPEREPQAASADGSPAAGPAAAHEAFAAPPAGPASASAAAPVAAGAAGVSLAAAWGWPRLAHWRRRLAVRADRARAAAWRAAPAAAAGLLVAGYLASPALGANAGGALSAALGFGALGARLAGGRRWKRTAPVLALLLVAALAGLWLLNHGAATGAEAHRQSHVGRAFEALLAGKFSWIGDIVLRKLEMNVHLIGVSAWSKVLLTGLAVMAVLVLRPRGRFRRWQRQYPYLMHGVAANVIGTIAALLLNDSGIVAAATMIVYSSVPLLLLKFDEAAVSDK
ncbi:hypothetical protein ACHHV8_33115 [Paenibacillus sp. TAB 01]|uniref:hypothetical protein n=1 Tax=Paenibacillus sp. TAB 01 TaxID=3368988 RepID=UPI0037529D6B